MQKGNTTVRSVWTNSVRNAFRNQAEWAKLQEVRATAAKHWTERVWYCHDQRWMQSSKEGKESSRSGSFKNGQEWGKNWVSRRQLLLLRLVKKETERRNMYARFFDSSELQGGMPSYISNSILTLTPCPYVYYVDTPNITPPYIPFAYTHTA